eukprot:2060529-Pyramimonas_sp.AAC.1
MRSPVVGLGVLAAASAVAGAARSRLQWPSHYCVDLAWACPASRSALVACVVSSHAGVAGG